MTISLILVIISNLFFSRILEEIIFSIFLLCIFVVFISVIYQLIKKEFFKSILSIVSIFLTISILLFYALNFGYYINQSKPDEFADDIKINKNIKFEIPLNNFKNIEIKIKSRKIDFQLYSLSQPGIYEFQIWIRKIEKGKVYLKAIELTKQISLSSNSLKERSLLSIENKKNEIVNFKSNRDFTIYEGDLNKPYLAKFEVWFIPDGAFKERKLIEKVYKIEGWQR